MKTTISDSPTTALLIQQEPITVQVELVLTEESQAIVRLLTRQKELFKRLMDANITAEPQGIILSTTNASSIAMYARSVATLPNDLTTIDVQKFNEAATGINELRFKIANVRDATGRQVSRIIITDIPKDKLVLERVHDTVRTLEQSAETVVLEPRLEQ